VHGHGGTHAVLLLHHRRDVHVRGHEHAVAQGMRPGRDRRARPEDRVAVSVGEERAAQRVVHQRVETPDPGTPVGHLRRVRGTVERQPRAPAPAAHVHTGVRADTVRRAEHPVHRVLAGSVAHRRRHRAVRHRVHHRFVHLLHHRHVRVLVRRDRRRQPHHATRVRVRGPAAGRHRGRPVRRLPERQHRFHRRVRPEHRHQRAGAGAGLSVRVRHVRTVYVSRFAVHEHVRPEHRRQKFQNGVGQARPPQTPHTPVDDRRFATDRRSFYW